MNKLYPYTCYLRIKAEDLICSSLELTSQEATRHIYGPLQLLDKLPARRDGGFFSYPSCTMKYVVRATCSIKQQHSKTKAGEILWAFNPSVGAEEETCQPSPQSL